MLLTLAIKTNIEAEFCNVFIQIVFVVSFNHILEEK